MPQTLNLLAFDTSTEMLSLALTWAAAGVPRQVEHQGAGGAQASLTLIPAVQRLLEEAGLKVGQLDAIVFGRGPGSFTGLRTACAVAQGLGFGAGVPVLPVDTLLAVAEDARAHGAGDEVIALLDARMEQVYAAPYRRERHGWQRLAEVELWSPEAVRVPPGFALVGNAFAAYGARLSTTGRRVEAAPRAAALLRLAPALLAAGEALPAARALPLYVRDKVAQTTEERTRMRAAAAAASAP